MTTVRRRECALVVTLRLIHKNQRMRRELIWLRAKEKGFTDALRFLERIDPDLRDRMVIVEEDIRSLERSSGSLPRTEAYARIVHARRRGCTTACAVSPCDCPSCRPSPVMDGDAL